MFSYSKRLLFGDEAKLEFKRSNTHGIGRLSAERHIPASDHRYWAQYTGVFDTPGEAFSLLAVTDVRRALVSAPENIRTLVRNLSQHLFSLLQDPLFSPPSEHAQARGVGAFLPNLPGVGGAGSKMQDGRNRVKEALNCVRVLARVLPVILEGDHDSSSSSQADSGDFSGSLASDSFEKTLLWTRESTPREESGTGGQERPSVPARSDSESETQFVIDDEEEQDESNSRMGSRQNSKNKIGTTSGDPLSLGAEGGIAAEVDDEKTLPCLAERLITTTLDLLFYGGFTIPWTEEQLENGADVGERVHYAIWESGVGSSVDLGSTRAHEAHRVEVLRLLLVLLSKSIYIPAHAHSSTDNPALRFVAQRLDRAIVLPFLCSLLNTAARHSAPAGLLGLPYTSLVRERLVGNGEDTRDMLVTLCLQTLNVILGYDPPGQVHSQGAPPSIDGDSVRPILHTTASTASLTSIGTASGGARSSIAPANMFRFYVSKLHRHADFVFLTSGICAILAQPMNAASQLLPIPTTATGGVGADAYVPETLMLLWRLCDHNKVRATCLSACIRSPGADSVVRTRVALTWWLQKYRAFLLDSDRSPEILACLLFYALQFRDVPGKPNIAAHSASAS